MLPPTTCPTVSLPLTAEPSRDLILAVMLRRIGISIEDSLLRKFDELIAARGYQNRSEAVRDLVRDMLVNEAWKAGTKRATGAVFLVYDHHDVLVSSRLTDIQHHSAARIISSVHVHLDSDNCLEIIILSGVARDIRRVADQLVGLRGVKLGKFVAMTARESL